MTKENKNTEVMEDVKILQPKPRIDNDGFEKIVDGATFHNFKENPIFVGRYIGTKVMDSASISVAHIFEDVDGSSWLIANNYSIEKALEKLEELQKQENCDFLLKIEYLGTSEKNGRKFNRFDIGYKKG